MKHNYLTTEKKNVQYCIDKVSSVAVTFSEQIFNPF